MAELGEQGGIGRAGASKMQRVVFGVAVSFNRRKKYRLNGCTSWCWGAARGAGEGPRGPKGGPGGPQI